jgi:hypothetical protein
MGIGAISRMGALVFLSSVVFACAVDAPSSASPGPLADASRRSTPPTDPICYGGNWCLVKCSASGETLHVIDAEPERGFAHCLFEADAWCIRHDLGRRTFACWGTPN